MRDQVAGSRCSAMLAQAIAQLRLCIKSPSLAMPQSFVAMVTTQSFFTAVATR